MPRRCLTSNTAPPPATVGTITDVAAAPAAQHLQWSLHGRAAVEVAVAGNVVVVVLFFAVIVWPLFFAGRSHQEGAAVSPHGDGADSAAVMASSSSERTPCGSPRTAGLGKEDLLALPVFVQGASADGERGGGRKKVECAVCISELMDGDTGRLLPQCGHRFHAECVDRWFRSHGTCPLCRTVVAHAGSKVASVV